MSILDTFKRSTLQNLENHIIKEFGPLRIKYNEVEKKWNYEVADRVKLSPEVQTGSLLCYSVYGKTREQACIKLYKALNENRKASQRMIEKYNKMRAGI